MMSKGDRTTDGLSHGNQKEQTTVERTSACRRKSSLISSPGEAIRLGSISGAAVTTEVRFQRAFLVFRRSACVHVVTVLMERKERGYWVEVEGATHTDLGFM